MSISIADPSHDPQMWEISRSPSTGKQSYRKYLGPTPSPPVMVVLHLTKPQTCPSSIVSRMDERSIVLCLHVKRLSAHEIHDDLVATLSPKAVAYSTVTCYLHEAKFGTTKVTLDLEPSSPHIDDSDQAILAALKENPFVRARTCPSHPYPTRYRL
jgi:hypothetical protein